MSNVKNTRRMPLLLSGIMFECPKLVVLMQRVESFISLGNPSSKHMTGFKNSHGTLRMLERPSFEDEVNTGLYPFEGYRFRQLSHIRPWANRHDIETSTAMEFGLERSAD